MEARSGRVGDSGRAVSHVIGTIVLVSITAVLVGMTAVYMTGFAEGNQEPAPRFATETEYNATFASNGQYLNLTHDSGAPLDTDSIYFKIQGAQTDAGGPASYEGNAIEAQVGAEFTAAETVSLDRTAFVDGSGNNLTGSTSLDLCEAIVRIVWAAEDTDRTEVIYECEVDSSGCC
jgi:FlaG/FlaF family flagellin (archaellin)